MEGIVSLDELVNRVAEVHNIHVERVLIRYMDDDGEYISVISNDDLVELIDTFKSTGLVKLFISESTVDVRKVDHNRRGNLEQSVLIERPQEPVKPVKVVVPRDEVKVEAKVESKVESRVVKVVDASVRDIVIKLFQENPDAMREILAVQGYEIVNQIDDSVLHEDFKCDECGGSPIKGARFSCNICQDFDICERCERNGNHDVSHPMTKYRIGKGVQAVVQPHMVVDNSQKSGTRLVAKLLEDMTIPDRSILVAASRHTKSWKFMNSGQASWPVGCKLVQISGEESVVDKATLNGISLPRVDVEGVVQVDLPIRIPIKEGHFIAYFRLADPQGQKFGPRIWVDFRVDAEEKGEVDEPIIIAEPVVVEPEPEPVVEQHGIYSSQLRELSGMGLNNDVNLNIFLLKKFDGDMNRVVDWHLARMK